MFPRYGRKNSRYKVKVPKHKISKEKRLIVQSVISALLVVIFIPLSFFGFMPHRKINSCLYDTYTADRWRVFFAPAARTIGNNSVKLVSAYIRWISEPDGKKEKKNKAEDTLTVKAEKEISNSSDTDTSYHTEPHGENYDKETVSAAENTPSVEEDTEKEVWRMPHPGEITSVFGERIHPVTGEKSVHTGIDIAAASGDDVYAVKDGVVERTGNDHANGNYVVLSHNNSLTSVYIHLSEILVSAGETVTTETIIGRAGSTGISTGPHLHFEIKEKGVSVDPKKYIFPEG